MSGTCRKPIQKLSDDMTQIRSDLKDIKRTLKHHKMCNDESHSSEH